LDCEEKQHQYDAQIGQLKNLEVAITSEGTHYEQLVKRYYELGDELVNAQNALRRLRPQQDPLSM
jgi:hypothetical protein